jgi:hypothetical protein
MTTRVKFLFVWSFFTGFFFILASSADPDASNDVFKAQIMAEGSLLAVIAVGAFVFTAACLMVAQRREANHFVDANK